MAKSRRGGARQPRKPAPVAAPGPGAGAGQNRTDGGPASSKQPIRRIPGQDYGEGKQLVEQQQAAPLPNNLGISVPNQQGMSQRPNVFGATDRPSEPVTEGVPIGDGSFPIEGNSDTNIFLAALYSVNPHPAIAELLNSGNE
jgi:hypothetical protein